MRNEKRVSYNQVPVELLVQWERQAQERQELLDKYFTPVQQPVIVSPTHFRLSENVLLPLVMTKKELFERFADFKHLYKPKEVLVSLSENGTGTIDWGANLYELDMSYVESLFK
jgi:hypothetical protein